MKRYKIEDLQRFAETKGGKCLSTQYYRGDTGYVWEDAQGNSFTTPWKKVLIGQWSPHELRDRMRDRFTLDTIEDLQKHAIKKGGKCLSVTYTNSKVNYIWEDTKGRQWEASWNNVKYKDRWSPHEQQDNSIKHTIEELQGIAESKGGKCLSTEYMGLNKKYLFEDKDGNQWETTAKVIFGGGWSPKEAHQKRLDGIIKYTIEDLKKYAIKKGGKCLSTEYISTNHKYLWEDSKGRKWEALWNNVLRSDHWSPYEKKSKPQAEVYDYIKSIYNGEVLYNDRTAITPLELDIYIPEKKLGIEYDGLYWHCELNNPKCSSRNIAKRKACTDNDINLLAIFSDEWNNPIKQELIKAMIRHRIGVLPDKKIRASKLELRKLEKNKEYKDFFDRYHLDGHSNASYAYGLFLEDEPLVVVSMRRSWKDGALEICRFANNYSYHVHGGFSRLFKHIKEGADADKIITFSNNRLSNGGVYNQLGFTEITKTKTPSYYYTNGFVRIWRFRCKRINDPEILSKYPTEKLQAKGGVFSRMYLGNDDELYKIFDYGHRKWMLEIK